MTDSPTQLETLTERDACLETQEPTFVIASPVKEKPPVLSDMEQMMLMMKQQIETLTNQLKAKEEQPGTSEEPNLKRKRTESPTRAAFEEPISDDDDCFANIVPVVPLHELSAEYSTLFKNMAKSPPFLTATKNKVYYSMVIEFPTTVANPKISFIHPYKIASNRMNGQLIHEQINLNYEWMDKEVVDQTVHLFKVPKPRSKMMNDFLLSKNAPGNKLESLISAILKDKDDTTPRTITIMQHNGPAHCGYEKFHYHMLVGVTEDGTVTNQKSFFKKATDSNLAPLTIQKTKMDVENIPHALAYMATKGPGRVYLGSTDPEIAQIMKALKGWHAKNPNIKDLPAVPTGIPVLDMDSEVNPFLGAIPSSHQVITVARHFDNSKVTKARTMIEFYVSLMNAIRIHTLSLHEYRKHLLLLKPTSESMVNMKFCLEQALYGHNHERLWDQHMARVSETSLKQFLNRFKYPDMKQKHFNMYADQTCTLFALQRIAPDWFRQMIKINLHILGKNGKKNCLYLYGRPSMGKTHVITLGLRYIFPLCLPNLTSSDFSLEELSLPHLLAIMDDCDPIIQTNTKMCEQLKNFMGGTECPVNVKHKSQKTAMTSPVLWLSNKTDFNFFNVTGDELNAFNERIIRMAFAENYPYIKSSGFWQFLHPVIMATLRSYLKLHKGSETSEDEIAEACWRYLKNQRNLLYRISRFSQPTMFQTWNSEASQDDFSDVRSHIDDTETTQDATLESLLIEQLPNPFDLRC